ncbi:hypothetical protein ACE1OC_33575 [Streptomyces sp. DSM 116496]|uniref:hypothetical protein n=1 Tax=Streptomyces stoeckheimensis TaxID=3344656 RepID=UPI0038B272B2
MNTRPSGFEDRLKSALLARLPEPAPATPARSFARRYGVPLAIGAATASVVAVMALPGNALNASPPGGGPAGMPSPSATDAPEIRKDPDGSLVFKLPTHDQVPALVRQLKALGVQAVVVPKRPRSQCSELGGGGRGPQADPEAEILQNGGDGFVLKVNAKTVPPGHTLMLPWADHYPPGAPGISFGVVETSRLPSCVIDHSDGMDQFPPPTAGTPGTTARPGPLTTPPPGP